MQGLTARLSALEADAAAALKAITYLDRLDEGRVDMETLVRGRAVPLWICGCSERSPAPAQRPGAARQICGRAGARHPRSLAPLRTGRRVA